MVSVAIGLVLAAVGASTEPAIEVPLSRWTHLQERVEVAPITVVEQARISGSFRNGELQLQLTGRATPRLATVEVLELGDALLFGCDGDALVSRSGSRYRLTPTATRFTVRCRLMPEGGDRIRLNAADAVLHLDATIDGGELFVSAPRTWDLVRSLPAAEVVPVVASGRHRLSLQHEDVRFRYEIDAHNPNRTLQSFDLRFGAGERISRVETSARWELDDGSYRFQLPPGSTTIAVSGTLLGASWTPPLDAPRQYVLIESHPLLLPTLTTEATRVSPRETGFGDISRGAQALLVDGGETLSWTVSAKETLRTTSFAVNAARHVFFIGTKGDVVGDSEYTVANQGAPGLSIPMSATPTYAGIDGEPTFLTRDDSGDLRLPLGWGTQTVEVQHRQRVRKLPGFVVSGISTPRIDASVTNSRVELRFPREWVPLYLSAGGTERVAFGPLPLALLLAVWAERCLAGLGITRRRWLLAGVIGLAAAFLELACVVVVLGLLATSALWALPRWNRRSLGRKLAIAGATILVGFLGLTVFGSDLRHFLGASTAALAGDTQVASRSAGASKASARPNLRNFASGGEEERDFVGQGGMSPAYQGLPAKVQLPWGNERASFSEELVSAGHSVRTRMLLVSRTLADVFAVTLGLIAFLVLFRRRNELRSGWLRLWSAAGFGSTEERPSVEPAS